jgi:hypothetical protein
MQGAGTSGSEYFEGFLDRPSQDGTAADLDYRPLNDRRIFDHRRDDLSIGRIRRDTQPFKIGLGTPQNIIRSHSRLFKQLREFFLCKGLDDLVDLVPIYTLLDKELGQIAAGSTGWFFVDGNLWHSDK